MKDVLNIGNSDRILPTAFIKKGIYETFAFLDVLTFFKIFMILSRSVMSVLSNCVTWGIDFHAFVNLLAEVCLIEFSFIFSTKPHFDKSLNKLSFVSIE